MKFFREFLCSPAGRELHTCGTSWAGQLVPQLGWSSQDLHKQSIPSARRVWWPHLQQEQWDCAQHLQHLGCLIFSAPVGCHNLKHFRNSRIHQMQTISKELLSYQMKLRHIIKIIFFSWILYRLFYSSNAWKKFQLDFNIVSIKESLQNALTRMKAKSPCRKVKKKIPNELSFYMKRGHILHVIRARAVFPSSSFTNMFIYWQLSVLPDMLKTPKFAGLLSCGIYVLIRNLCKSDDWESYAY